MIIKNNIIYMCSSMVNWQYACIYSYTYIQLQPDMNVLNKLSVSYSIWQEIVVLKTDSKKGNVLN